MKVIFIIGMVVYSLLFGCTGAEKESSFVDDGSSISSAAILEETIEGAYVNSFSCDYLSQSSKPDQYVLYLVTNDEELAYAEDYLGMKVPDDEDREWYFNDYLANEFQAMKEEYPIDEYNYLIQYYEYSQGGYYFHADSVVYSDDLIYFHFDISEAPDGPYGTDEMGGDFHMAAVPKEFFEDKNFTNTVSPLD